MNLLIITQALDLDDPILGFFHGWVELFAQSCSTVTVICLRKGRYELPRNVEVISLGKEQGASRPVYVARFYRAIVAYRTRYDAVFVHMNPEYVILGGILWRLWGKRVGMWYTHKAVNLRLVIATLLANIVFTASKESFRYRSRKVRIMGHGIDTDRFTEAVHPTDLRIITVGRITEAKQLKEMLPVLDVLYEQGHAFTMRFVGAPAGAGDIAYENALRAEIRKRPYAPSVSIGSVTNDMLPRSLTDASVFLHMSTTGSVDKAVLEALATGLPVVTTSAAYPEAPVIHAPPEVREIAKAIVESRHGNADAMATYVRETQSLAVLIRRLHEALLV